MDPLNKDPSDLSINFRIAQFDREGMVRAAWSRMHPHWHLPTPEWMVVVADEGPQEVYAHQRTL
jgi:hypothetical protein